MAGNHHRDPRFIRIGKLVRSLASANPGAVCWRCGLTLDEHPPHRSGKRPTWQAGHTIDGTFGPGWFDVAARPPAGAWIAPEASTCNTSAGAVTINAKRSTGFDWP